MVAQNNLRDLALTISFYPSQYGQYLEIKPKLLISVTMTLSSNDCAVVCRAEKLE